MKDKKEPKAEIMAFYVGGAKLHAVTTHTKEELEKMLVDGMNENKKAVLLDTVNESGDIEEDSLILAFDKLLFATVLLKNRSGLILPDRKIEVTGGNSQKS